MAMRHSDEIQRLYERILAASSVHGRLIEVNGEQEVHIAESGDGPPLLLFHGTGNSALFLLPLLECLGDVRAVAVDRPGWGLSDPVDLPRDEYREAVVAWISRLLDVCKLDTAALLGNSIGGLWSIWFALAHPDQVSHLILVGGAPLLPETRSPFPFRLMATPVLGELLQRQSSGPEEILQFARFVGEEDTLPNHPRLIDLLVAIDRDPVAAATLLDETRTILSPFALFSSAGWRPRLRVQPDELKQLAMPTLLVWGENEPVGNVAVAQTMTELIPDAHLEVLPTGHGPWLGFPEQTASLITDFVK